MKCLFCPNDLDGSDEHIILNCLNGKLHSKNIICSECNNYFGRFLDPKAKSYFNPILLALGISNASGVIAENLDGEDLFIVQSGGKILHRKPKIIEKNIKGKKIISIQGDKKNALKLFESKKKKLSEQGIKLIQSRIREEFTNQPLRYKVNFQTNEDLDLIVNKICLEYCSHNKIESNEISQLALKIKSGKKGLDNIYYINSNQEIRKFDSNEITHVLTIWNKGSKIYAYMELFNVVCAVVEICNDFTGENIEYTYYQDAVTGEKYDFSKLDTSKLKSRINTFSKSSKIDFSENANSLFYRFQQKSLSEYIYEGLDMIDRDLKQKYDDGIITKEELTEIYIDQTTSFVAKTQIENPYLFDDIDDVHNDDLNYIHSNIREDELEEFNNHFKILTGVIVKFEDNSKYIIESIEKIPIIKQKQIQIYRMVIILNNGLNKIYIPYREFLENISDEI